MNSHAHAKRVLFCNSANERASYVSMSCRLHTALLSCGALVLMIAPLRGHAASFDCAKAQRPVEKVICGDPKLNAADETLGREYRAMLAKVPPAVVAEVRGDQVQWLAWMQQVCQADVAGRPAAETAKCMSPVYGSRIKLLRNAVVTRGGILFVTRTQYIAAPEPKEDAMGVPDFPGFGTLQASWPEAVSSDTAWTAWNHAVALRASLLSGSEDEVKKAGPRSELRGTPELADEQDTVTTVEVKSVEHGRITSASSVESMGHGAAHPNEASSTMTWLLEPKRELRADDVFLANSGWQEKVAALCWAQIAKQGADNIYPEVKGSDAKALREVVADVSNWTLQEDGLRISYPEYSISPRAAPIDDSVITWEQLKPLLSSGFTVP